MELIRDTTEFDAELQGTQPPRDRYPDFSGYVSYKVAEPPGEHAPERPRLYLDTSIPSYLVSRLSRDITTARRQRITREWWGQWRQGFDIYVSQRVLAEASIGDPGEARKRMLALESFPLLQDNEQIARLFGRLLNDGGFPAKAIGDATHVAIAAVHGVRFLLTWNCKHLANPRSIPKMARIIAGSGYVPPIICTPEDLVKEYAYERSHP